MKSIFTILTLLFSQSLTVFSQQGSASPDPVKSREMIRQWVQTERLLSEEKNAWKVEKQRMQDLLDLYQEELKLLNEEIEKAGSSADSVDERKGKLEAELQEFRAAQRLLADTMARLLPRMKVLIDRFPEPLQDELGADIDYLRSPEALAKPRDVLKSMLAVLSEAGRFNRTITLAEETRTLEGGKKMTVNVLYLGLARAFFATTSGDTAGVGTPSKVGWSWQDRPDFADDVRRAIAVYRKDKQPQLVPLPVGVSSSNETAK
ncbi:hypothetical protein NT6N_33430 [Oceaniferula spumae]|uniref:DUF3450 family protein n=1 Tax=Oceaniferula spumae TaxID=2979115 RepID=A0AAT9FQP7_9BACT